MLKLPKGIQSIEKILGGADYVYVDKTMFAKRLIENGSPHFFMSRPRRFGKSLFISTLEEIFKGNRELFKNCQIYQSDYDWQSYSLLRIDFSRISNRDPILFEAGLKELLEKKASSCGFSIQGVSMPSLLTGLIKGLTKDTRIVVLVDEYDHPIINNLDSPCVAEKNRDLLKEFYATLKSLDKHIRFTFITGVSKFSQVSLFSGPNYLTDVTMEDEYAHMMGYTEEEMYNYFTDHMSAIAASRSESGIDAVLDEVRLWYNGYKFSGAAIPVYNPFSTLNYMDLGKPKSYWYRSGTPSFLINQVKKYPQNLVPLSGATSTENNLMDISDLKQIDLVALMFQTGYLTIKEHTAGNLYRLGFPNSEVEQAFMESLVNCFADVSIADATSYQEALEEQNIVMFFDKLKALFASFPYHLFSKATEATYHGMLLALVKGMGFDASAEVATNLGRIDLIIEMPETTYIFECKLDKNEDVALSQITQTKYFEKYLNRDKKIILIGVNFSSKERNISSTYALDSLEMRQRNT